MIKETLLAGTIALSLTGCSSFLPEVTKYSTEPVERPLLVLPESEIVNMKEVDYIVVTEENIQEVWAELEASGKSIVLFALTSDGFQLQKFQNHGFEISIVEKYGEHLGFKDSDYKELGVEILTNKSEVLNNADIIRYLSEQKAVIIAYKEYYEKADKAIVDANDKNTKEAKASDSFSIKKFLNSD